MRSRSGILARAFGSVQAWNTVIEIENPHLEIDGNKILNCVNPVVHACDVHATTGLNSSAEVDIWRRRS
jgi:hypothetical protein